MSETILKATKRVPGRTTAKHLRLAGKVPGVYYANNQEPVHFTCETLDLRGIIYTAEAKVVTLRVDDGKGLACILKDVTFDPVSDKILHFDLLGISAGQKLTVEIPIHLTGNSVGARDGGIIEHVMHKAHVLVDPTKMPEHIDVDISNLAMNSSIHISDISVEGVEFMERAEAVIVTCVPPKTHVENAAVEQPTVVGEEKKEA